VPPGTYAVVLAARDEGQLVEIEQHLVSRGVAYRAIRETDKGGELMAIGVEPRPRSMLRRHLSSLPLLR
jgi:hypothetical protein